MTKPDVSIIKDGPYILSGNARFVRRRIITDGDGATGWEDLGEITPKLDDKGAAHLCRCGHSNHKPFCDGSHKKVGFDGTETASTTPYDEEAHVTTSHGTDLGDDRPLCAHSTFCLTKGDDIWHMQERDLTPEAADRMVEMIQHCPTGRLNIRKEGAAEWDEPDLPSEVVFVENGQIYVTGGVSITRSDGATQEARNRVSLCRCGQSRNKPFCDGTHFRIRFSDDPAEQADAGQA